ncbi:hypothetical protein EYF80_000331 [Liparis tanakae]|uniref:Uncharacterized protein n=1 Tax=Liparis tanakae TaxID=230148 RepID=A0A4Z2JJB3_9TELE|nr:hypothetical protein EYF80_000331 [Liparis tanakae]
MLEAPSYIQSLVDPPFPCPPPTKPPSPHRSRSRGSRPVDYHLLNDDYNLPEVGPRPPKDYKSPRFNLAVRGPESSLIPPTPVSETTGEALGVFMVREDSDGEKVGVMAEGTLHAPMFSWRHSPYAKLSYSRDEWRWVHDTARLFRQVLAAALKLLVREHPDIGENRGQRLEARLPVQNIVPVVAAVHLLLNTHERRERICTGVGF